MYSLPNCCTVPTTVTTTPVKGQSPKALHQTCPLQQKQPPCLWSSHSRFLPPCAPPDTSIQSSCPLTRFGFKCLFICRPPCSCFFSGPACVEQAQRAFHGLALVTYAWCCSARSSILCFPLIAGWIQRPAQTRIHLIPLAGTQHEVLGGTSYLL